MSEIDRKLARLDLNLLTSLHALLHHRSVSNAAAAVGRTQSAMSHSLSKLRHHFQDPILVRDGWAMKLTPTGQAMAAQVAQVAAAVEALFDGNTPFDPGQSTRTIRIATRDICVPLLAPLIGRIAQAGPGLSVEIAETTRIRATIAAHEADIGLGFGRAKESATLQSRFVGNTSWCVFAPDGHPYIDAPDTEHWAAASHILVGSPGAQTGPVEQKAAALGITRHIACYAPTFTAALTLAADCGALFTTLREPFTLKGTPPGMTACPIPFVGEFAMPFAPAVLTLRAPWNDPFETWLTDICRSFSVTGP